MALIDLVKRDKEMRRIFGEQELKIIEKQLLGVNLSASEKTRLSRDIRTKFEIIRRLSDFKNEFELKKASEIKYIINEAKDIILESKWKNKIKEIRVFGSFINNNLRFNSDIDLSVEFDKITEKEADKFKLEMLGKLPVKIQIQIFNFLPNKIKEEIRKGRIIYKKNDKSVG
jgi:predicted nucleotidyltransferase